jgi:hypothetical protein
MRACADLTMPGRRHAMADSPTQVKTFLSHSSADKTVCHQLVAALREAGADV